MEIVTTPRIAGPITLAPIGDVQLAGKEGKSGLEHFKRHLDYVMNQENPWLFGLGDYVDVASPSGRQKIKSAAFYDSVEEALTDSAERHIEQFLDAVKGTEGRWLGMLEGHHFYEFSDGSTSDTRICRELKTTFLGTSAMIQIPVSRGRSSTYKKLTIWCHHGVGSGSRATAPVSKLETLISGFEADIYVMGHMSKKAAAPIDQLFVNQNGKLDHRTKMLVGSGGFAQGYQQGSTSAAGNARGSYVEIGMMKPVALGAPVLRVQLDNYGGLDIHVSI